MIYVINCFETKEMLTSYHITSTLTVSEAVQFCKMMNEKYDYKFYYYDEVPVARVRVPDEH